jgi:putative addiction module component (TIGR02574 family)
VRPDQRDHWFFGWDALRVRVRFASQQALVELKLTGIRAFAILRGMTDLAPELARLSPRQRLDLIESLWESLDERGVPVTDAQRAELDRRIVGFDQDGEESIPWDQLRAELRQQR